MTILKFTGALVFMFSTFFISSYLLGTDSPKTIYYFIEAENTSPLLQDDWTRKTGFTGWMGTPSGGKVVVFGAPWNYAVKDLPAGIYNIWIRQLNWRSDKKEEAGKTANTEVKIKGQKIGETYYEPQLGIALRWSNVGQAKLDGTPFILNINLAASNMTSPYMDVILLTDDLNYTPEFADQDFKSFQRIDKNIKLNSVALDGVGKNAMLLVSILSPDDFVGCQAEARFGDESKRSLRVFKTFCDIKKGENKLPIPISGLEKGSYPVRVQIISPDSQTVIASADFRVEAGEAWKVTMENHYLLPTETLCQVKVSVTDSNLATKAKNVRLGIVNGNIKLAEKDYPLNTPLTDITYDTKSLVSGKYEVRVDLLDGNERSLENATFPLIKTQISGDFPKLEPVKKVEIINDIIIVNGKSFVPRKLFHTNADLKFAQQGYNAVDCWGNPDAIKQSLDEATRNNMYGYAVLFSHFYDPQSMKFDLEGIKECVYKLKEHPALFCWLLFDEPDGVGLRANDVMAAANVIRDADPNHPVIIDYCQSAALPVYAGCSDFSGVDVYPFPNMPLTTVSKMLDALRESIKSQKCRAVEISMQTYAEPAATRMPTPDEYRAMLYLAINHGARSFADFSWYMGENYKLCLMYDNLLWSYMKIINREILTLEKVISSGQASSANVKCTNEQIDWSLREANGEIYLIAVNTTSKKTAAEFTLPAGFVKPEAVFDQEAFSIKGGNLHLDFNSFQVHILKLKKERSL